MIKNIYAKFLCYVNCHKLFKIFGFMWFIYVFRVIITVLSSSTNGRCDKELILNLILNLSYIKKSAKL